MPKQPFVRVRDKETGHEFTTKVVGSHLVVLKDQPAVNKRGKPLPPKPGKPEPKPKQGNTPPAGQN